jgi:hypothetical protein
VAFKHEDIIKLQHERLVAERGAAVADLENSRFTENEYGTMDAADRIIQADAKLAALGRIADQYVAQQQVPQGNRYGLNQDEQDVAKASGLTDEQYYQNRQKLRHLRATGQYRDDQGTVKR